MSIPDSAPLELDLHRLELRYASARLLEPRAVEQLARSIDKNDQLVACIAVAVPEAEPLVLLDGYRRVAALRRLGRDTARVECWDCDLVQGLITILSRAHGRAFAALEEALLLRELIQGQGLSQHEVARRCGRDVSWVNRRLQLLCALPDAALAAVRDGVLSIWAATRVVVPLARANTEHADGLLGALRAKSLSTRELRRWFEHYQRANRTQRERLVGHPHLFCEVVQQSEAQRALERLRAGPEGECLIDLRSIEGLIARLRKRLPALCAEALPEALVSALARLQRTLEALQNELKRYYDHDPRPDPPLGAHAAHPRQQPARDQPATQALT
jgi:ParB family transcriptional regulator, chromosome partitioning protein